MIIDQLFEDEKKKKLDEINPHNYDSDEDYYAAVRGKRGSSDDDYDYDDDEEIDDMDDDESYYEKHVRTKNLEESRRYILEERRIVESVTYKQFHRVGRMLAERKLTEPEILQVFADAEANMTNKDTGANRTALGRGKDTVGRGITSAKDAVNNVLSTIQNSAPVAGVDVAYDKATDALANAVGNNSKVMDSIKKYRLLAKEYPKTQLFVKSALIALAGLATGGAGLPAIAGLTAAVDAAIKGEKLSSLIGKGAGAAIMGLAGQKLHAALGGHGTAQVPGDNAHDMDMMSDQGPGSQDFQLPDADAAMNSQADLDAAQDWVNADAAGKEAIEQTTGMSQAQLQDIAVSNDIKPDMGSAGITGDGGGMAGQFDGGQYDVVKGDTLGHIAQANGVSVEDIKGLNPQINWAKPLQPGMTLNLPPQGDGAGSVWQGYNGGTYGDQAASAGGSGSGMSQADVDNFRADNLARMQDQADASYYQNKPDDYGINPRSNDAVGNAAGTDTDVATPRIPPKIDQDQFAKMMGNDGGDTDMYTQRVPPKIDQDQFAKMMGNDGAGDQATSAADKIANGDYTQRVPPKIDQDQFAKMMGNDSGSQIDYSQPGPTGTDSLGNKLEYGIPVNDKGSFIPPSQDLPAQELATQQAAYDAWKSDFMRRFPNATQLPDGTMQAIKPGLNTMQIFNKPTLESIKFKKLPANELIDQKLTVLGWALNESVNRKSNSISLTNKGVYTVFENVDRCRKALLEYTNVQPGRPELPDQYRPDMPGGAGAPAKPGLIGRGLNWLDKAAGKVGGALSNIGHQFTTGVTKEKLKMNWHQAGKPSDSDQLAAWLVKQGVPQEVVTSVFGKMGIPYTATAAAAPAGSAQRQAYAGTNPATGKPWTVDELQARMNPAPAAAATGTAPTSAAPATATTPAATAKTTAASPAGFNAANVMKLPGMEKYAKKPATAPAKTPNFAGPGGYAKVNQPTSMSYSGMTGTKPAATPAPAGTKVTTGGPTPDEQAKLAQRIAQATAKPVAEMLQMVETKEDVQRIKKFIDDTFVKHGAVTESAFAVRNKIIEHITQVGAQRRREHARKGA
jgi:LysM repeat protein